MGVLVADIELRGLVIATIIILYIFLDKTFCDMVKDRLLSLLVTLFSKTYKSIIEYHLKYQTLRRFLLENCIALI